MRYHYFAALASVLICVSPLLAQEAGGNESAPDGQGTLITKVTNVEGVAFISMDGRKSWQSVSEGDTIPEGAWIRTGIGDKISMMMGENSLIVVDRMSMVKIDALRQRGDLVTTRLNLERGMLKAGIERGRIRSDFSVQSPTAVASLRGSILGVSVSDLGMEMRLDQGKLYSSNIDGRFRDYKAGICNTDDLELAVDLITLENTARVLDPMGASQYEHRLAGTTGNQGVDPNAGGPSGDSPSGYSFRQEGLGGLIIGGSDNIESGGDSGSHIIGGLK